MSSPVTDAVTDEYANLVAPWKPMAGSAIKDVSFHHRIQMDKGTKAGDLAEMDSNYSVIEFDSGAEHGDVDISDSDSVTSDMIVNNGYQMAQTHLSLSSHAGSDKKYSDMYLDNKEDYKGKYAVGYTKKYKEIEDFDKFDIESGVGDEYHINNGEVTDTDNDANDTSQRIDEKCAAVPTCLANSGDHRKVVSHVFGRNKGCTRELPKDYWIFWCRKHYQRFKYRAEEAGKWHTRQLELVRDQLGRFENWGEVRTWTITLRKAELDALAAENANGRTYTDYSSLCWERFLVPYCGPNKTFAQVHDVLNVIALKFNDAEFQNRPKNKKTFPGVEFLPAVRITKEVKKPMAKKGQTTYKKITLDQPAFKRKNDANKKYLKEMAAKNAEAANTPESAASGFKKDHHYDTDKKDHHHDTDKKEHHHDTDTDSYYSATETRVPPTTDKATKDFSGHKHKFVILTPSTFDKATKDFAEHKPSSSSTKAKTFSPTPTKAKAKDFPSKRKPKTPMLGTQPGHSPTNKALIKRRRLIRGYEKNGSDGEYSTPFKVEEEESD